MDTDPPKRSCKEILADLELVSQGMNSLDKASISQIKSYKIISGAPLFGLGLIASIFNIKNEWESIKKFITSHDFIDRLRNFNMDGIAPKGISNCLKIINDPHFNVDEIKKANMPIYTLVNWAKCVVKYYQGRKEIAIAKKWEEEHSKKEEEKKIQ